MAGKNPDAPFSGHGPEMSGAPAKQSNTLLQAMNSASSRELMGLCGVSARLADQIVQHRPYASEDDVLERALIPKRAFDRIRKQFNIARSSAA